MQNHNPYSNNSPYGNNNPYQSQNNDVDRQLQAQRKLEEERKKQQYKFQAEQSLDNIVHEFVSAQHNQLNKWNLNAGDKAAVIRYYKRYWDNQFISISILVTVITAILSFYTPLAFSGIFVVFLLRELYSQRIFLTYMLNDHELSRKQITEIKDKIFYKQLKTTTTLIFVLVLMAISIILYFYSNTIFLEPEKYPKLIEILSKLSPFHPENELFAYTNIIAIFALLLLKTYEKWSK